MSSGYDSFAPNPNDAFDFQGTSDISGDGTWIDRAGTYLLKIQKVNPHQNAKGEMEDGTITLDCVVVGTDEMSKDQIGKTSKISARRPRLDDKNEGAFHKKKMQCIAVATGQAKFGAQQQQMIPQAMVGRHLIACYTNQKGNDGKDRVQLNFSDIWHVDDPKGAGAHLHPDFVASLPQEHREDPRELAKWYGSGSTPAQPQQQSQEQSGSQKASSLFDGI